MPFIAVACDTPGGFGQAAPGGTTKYTGVDLITGGAPEVSPPDKVREGVVETLDPQPLALFAALLMLAGIGVAIAAQNKLIRSAVNTGLAGLAAICLVSTQIIVHEELRRRLEQQMTGPLPEGKQISDYVHTESGFVLCMITLVLLVMVNGVGWLRQALRQ